MHVIGLDIGGANIKAASSDGRAFAMEFAIWKSPSRLQHVLSQVLGRYEKADYLAVTMTAELADCFITKSEGVAFILDAVSSAAATVPIAVWQTGSEFVAPNVAREIPLLVAAANWHALATWAGRMVPHGASLLIDVGSTTTDIIPLENGLPVPVGFTDAERLQSGELVYSGVRRTPVCALTGAVPFRGAMCPVAAELFATMLDVYLLLGEIAKDESDCNTANAKPATKSAAHDRLARMLCCDRSELPRDEAESIARYLADVQKKLISSAIDRVLARRPIDCAHVLLSGSGTFLARSVVASHPALRGAQWISLEESMSPDIAAAACAFAVARLANERLTL
ncbi:MAG: hydantoinase/oxoprolinase family protein [Planctomycetaceae bacterium]